ncbi:MAG: RIP metalloprotease RseP, partial [Ignavibacteria bacterium]
MGVVNTILYFLIVIIILVFVHEFGHFIAAKICKMRVDKFYLFFDFFNLRFFKFVRGDTEYGVGAFPLGGYVKVAGMIDESMDKEFISQPPQPWEFRSKPVYQRMFVITAGVIMNTLLAFLIFYAIVLVQGKNRMETTEIGYVSKNSIAEKVGLKSGDKIISINEHSIKYWDEVRSSIFLDNLGEDLDIEVSRGGEVKNFFIPKDELRDLSERTLGIHYSNSEPEIIMVLSDRPAAISGLKPGDKIIEANGENINHSYQFTDLIKSNWNKNIHLKWIRDGNEMTGVVHPDPDSTIGISIGKFTGTITTINYNFITAIPEGINDLYKYGVVLFLKSMWKIIKGDIAFSKAVGGPIKIAQIAGQSAEGGIIPFLGFMAILSITLAVINILPFP